MSVTALFATAGATNAGLYPATGLSDHLAVHRPVPAGHGRADARRRAGGAARRVVAIVVLVLVLDLSAIASIGSAVALIIFTWSPSGHLRVRRETGARPSILVLALATAGITLITFVFTTLIHEPASIVTLLVILLGCVGLDLVWSARRQGPAVGAGA